MWPERTKGGISVRRVLHRSGMLIVMLLSTVSYGGQAGLAASPTPSQDADLTLEPGQILHASARPSRLRATQAEKVDGIILDAQQRILSALTRGLQARQLEALSVEGVRKVDAQGRIHCYIVMDAATEQNLQALAAVGFQIELAVGPMNLAQGWLPAEAVDAVAALPFVRRIQPPSYAVPRCLGSACTEGDAILNADDVRGIGFDGTGVRVGVISAGADHLADAQASGDLPASITIDPSLPGSGDEGTAMLEIVYDLAPGAELYFSGPGTSAEMVAAITWLAQTAGVDVIVDDLGFYAEPYFEDGPIASAARDAVNTSGRVYCSAAGNDCGYHYQGMYEADGTSGPYALHDFKPGAETDNTLNVVVDPDQMIVAFLQWNDCFGSSGNDYDVLLYDFTADTQVGTGGQNVQNGNDDPVEIVYWTNTDTASHNIGVLVGNYLGSADARTLEVFCWLPFSDDDATCEDSVFGHPAVEEVISVGTINASEPGNDAIAWYSSRGASTIACPSPEVRQTPFCVAIDGVTVSGAGGFPSPFYGTSAAAPHAAAVAALLLDAADLAASPEEIRNAMAAGAADRGPAGFDNSYGYGLLDALGAWNATQASLTVQADGACPGAVELDPPGSSWPWGTQIELTAVADDPACCQFAGWSGDVPAGHELDNPLVIVMNTDKTITATFELPPPAVQIVAAETVAEHGGLGEIGLPINLAASSLPADSPIVTTESRDEGIYKLVVTFDDDVCLPADPLEAVESVEGVDCGGQVLDVTGHVLSVTVLGDQMTILLNPLPDAYTYTVTLSASVAAGDRDFLIRALQGEVSNTGGGCADGQIVNALDLSRIRLSFLADPTAPAPGHPVPDMPYAAYDIVSDGVIDALDLSTCRTLFTDQAP